MKSKSKLMVDEREGIVEWAAGENSHNQPPRN